MKSRYRMFAGYNAWCNERLYAVAATVPDADYRADRGAFFKSLHGTLNHLLVGDRIWMRRFTGVGAKPPALDAILYDDFATLREERRKQDTLITRYIDRLSDADLNGVLRYTTVVRPQTIEQPLMRRSTTSSTTRPTTAARRTRSCRRSSATTRRRAST